MPILGKILIVDDDLLNLEALKQQFMDDYEILAASSGSDAISICQNNRDLDAIILDIRMAEMDGLETANRIRAIDSDIPIIFHTAYPGDYSEEEVEQKHHPYDYVGKNEQPSRLIRSVNNAVKFNRLRTQSDVLIKLAQEHYGMIGHSQPMCEIYRTIEQIGPSDSKVMIFGPTGSGKELVAQAIHRRSQRADKSLAIFNCNHRTPDLVESELFGHKKGPFTGAIADRSGILEFADEGTLFLDEIGNLDITTQGKFLRVLETGQFNPIGSNEMITVDVRLLCATNSDLKQMVSDGVFREDLYYRLKGVNIQLPALKDRREDIPELIQFFSTRHCQTHDHDIRLFSPEAIDMLIDFDWPGNVRELMDVIQSLIDISPSGLITDDDVAKHLQQEKPSSLNRGNLSDRVKEFKRTEIIKIINRYPNNLSEAARELGIHRANLARLLKDLNIDISHFD